MKNPLPDDILYRAEQRWKRLAGLGACVTTYICCTEEGEQSIMNVKNGKWSTVKEMLFTYLAITKILYWINTITAMNQSDLDSVGRAVLTRLMNQDIMIILGVIAFFFLEKAIALKRSKYSTVLQSIMLYAVGYVMLLAIMFIYFLIISLIYGSVQVDSWGALIGYNLFLYIVICIVLEIKERFKAKGKKPPEDIQPARSTEDKLSMLQALLDDGIVTQEEFDSKKEMVLNMG